jgi:hypothetical protein
VTATPGEGLEAMIAAYYAARGWNTDGLVPEALVQEMNLQDLTK